MGLALTVFLLLAMTLAPAAAEAGQVNVTVQIQGAGHTEVVEGSIEDGADGRCNWLSNTDERITRSCTRFRNEELLEAWVWLRAHPSTVPSGHWRFVQWQGCDQTRTVNGFTECAVHSGPIDAAERSPKAIFADDFAPTVSPVTETFSTVSERTVSYFFSTNEGTLQCRFDSEPGFSACASGVTRAYATEGPHTIEVRAVDPSGQVSGTSSRTVTVVDTAVTGGPPPLTDSRTATFTYSSEAGTAYECALDTTVWSPCGPGTSKTYTGLTDGPHTFRVRASKEGWFDHVPVVRTWTVDATPPDTTIGSHPDTPAEGSTAAAGSATFVFGASESSTFQCRLDGGAFAPCSAPHQLTGLAPGDHTLAVRAVDQAGNPDPTPAQRSWRVAYPDADGDGYDASRDCDDGAAGVNPGRPEVPDNGVDENCDGVKGASPAPGAASGGQAFAPPPADTTAPVVRLSVARGQGLAAVRRKGLRASVTSNEAAAVRLELLLPAKLARKLGLSRKARAMVVARSGEIRVGGGSVGTAVKLSRKAKAALRRLRSARLELRLTAVDAAGNRAVASARVTLKR